MHLHANRICRIAILIVMMFLSLSSNASIVRYHNSNADSLLVGAYDFDTETNEFLNGKFNFKFSALGGALGKEVGFSTAFNIEDNSFEHLARAKLTSFSISPNEHGWDVNIFSLLEPNQASAVVYFIPNVSSVPEPNTIAMLILGLLGLMLYRRSERAY